MCIYSGKTRYGKEIFRHIQKHWVTPDLWKKFEDPHFEYIILDFGNDVRLDKNDQLLSTATILGLRLAWTFFVKGSNEMSFMTFRSEAIKYEQYFQFETVVTAIRKHLQLATDRKLFIFLHVDEFQEIFDYERQNPNTPKARLFKDIQGILGTCMTGDKKFFIQTFFSGTERRSIIETRKSSTFAWTFIDCPLLPLFDCVAIMRHFAKNYGFSDDKQWILESWVHQLLSDMGGLPRALELLLNEFFGDQHENAKTFFNDIKQHSDDASKYLTAVANQLNDRYAIKDFVEKHRKLALEITYRSLGSIPTKRSEVLSHEESDIGLTLDVLESDKHLILKNINEHHVLMQLPFVFLHLYNEVLQVVRGSLVASFSPTHEMQWQEWEFFLAEFEVFRNSLLVHLGHDIIKLGEIYRGAYGHNDTLNRDIKLSNLDVIKIDQQFPPTDHRVKQKMEERKVNIKDWQPNDKYGDPVDWKNGHVVINGKNAPFGDCFLYRQVIPPDNRNLIVCLQARFRKASLTIADIASEHKKYQDRIDGAPLELGLNNFRLTTVFITNQRLREGENIKKIPEDCILVSWHNFEKYFGEIFASRAAFHMARQRNPNFGDPILLMEPGRMDKDHAAEIKKNRPFESLDDFYQKVKWAKKREEYFGFNKLGDFSFYPYDKNPPPVKSFVE